MLWRNGSYQHKIVCRFLNDDVVRPAETGQVDIPAIVVDSIPMTPPIHTRDITQLNTSFLPSPGSLAGDASYASDSPSSPSGWESHRRLSDFSVRSGDIAYQLSQCSLTLGNDLTFCAQS